MGCSEQKPKCREIRGRVTWMAAITERGQCQYTESKAWQTYAKKTISIVCGLLRSWVDGARLALNPLKYREVGKHRRETTSPGRTAWRSPAASNTNTNKRKRRNDLPDSQIVFKQFGFRMPCSLASRHAALAAAGSMPGRVSQIITVSTLHPIIRYWTTLPTEACLYGCVPSTFVHSCVSENGKCNKRDRLPHHSLDPGWLVGLLCNACRLHKALVRIRKITRLENYYCSRHHSMEIRRSSGYQDELHAR